MPVLLISPRVHQRPGAIRTDEWKGSLVKGSSYESHFLSAQKRISKQELLFFIFSSTQSIIQHVYFEIVLENSSQIDPTCH